MRCDRQVCNPFLPFFFPVLETSNLKIASQSSLEHPQETNKKLMDSLGLPPQVIDWLFQVLRPVCVPFMSFSFIWLYKWIYYTNIYRHTMIQEPLSMIWFTHYANIKT